MTRAEAIGGILDGVRDDIDVLQAERDELDQEKQRLLNENGALRERLDEAIARIRKYDEDYILIPLASALSVLFFTVGGIFGYCMK